MRNGFCTSISKCFMYEYTIHSTQQSLYRLQNYETTVNKTTETRMGDEQTRMCRYWLVEDIWYCHRHISSSPLPSPLHPAPTTEVLYKNFVLHFKK
uniref:Ovule protein n=1 Tax=Ascaris lumbricoides TaxID=6252 RepID=A0A0M3I4U3_ASCLU